jgi:hypothetical protein
MPSSPERRSIANLGCKCLMTALASSRALSAKAYGIGGALRDALESSVTIKASEWWPQWSPRANGTDPGPEGLPPPAFSQQSQASETPGDCDLIACETWNNRTINLRMNSSDRALNHRAKERRLSLPLRSVMADRKPLRRETMPDPFGRKEYWHVTHEEMQRIIQNAVDNVYTLLGVSMQCAAEQTWDQNRA